MLKSHVDQCARGRVNIPIIDRLRFNGGKIPSCYRNIAQAVFVVLTLLMQTGIVEMNVTPYRNIHSLSHYSFFR